MREDQGPPIDQPEPNPAIGYLLSAECVGMLHAECPVFIFDHEDEEVPCECTCHSEAAEREHRGRILAALGHERPAPPEPAMIDHLQQARLHMAAADRQAGRPEADTRMQAAIAEATIAVAEALGQVTEAIMRGRRIQ